MIKTLLPSLREKKRYLAYEVLSNEKLAQKSIEKAILGSIKGYIGDLGLSKSGIIFLKHSGNKGVLRTTSKFQDYVRASFALVKSIDDKQVIIRSLLSSGNINKVKRVI